MIQYGLETGTSIVWLSIFIFDLIIGVTLILTDVETDFRMIRDVHGPPGRQFCNLLQRLTDAVCM